LLGLRVGRGLDERGHICVCGVASVYSRYYI
jgi:hypothetical protein